MFLLDHFSTALLTKKPIGHKNQDDDVGKEFIENLGFVSLRSKLIANKKRHYTLTCLLIRARSLKKR